MIKQGPRAAFGAGCLARRQISSCGDRSPVVFAVQQHKTRLTEFVMVGGISRLKDIDTPIEFGTK
jgi:hypothetical protein